MKATRLSKKNKHSETQTHTHTHTHTDRPTKHAKHAQSCRFCFAACPALSLTALHHRPILHRPTHKLPLGEGPRVQVRSHTQTHTRTRARARTHAHTLANACTGTQRDQDAPAEDHSTTAHMEKGQAHGGVYTWIVQWVEGF
jgi:hypothetical protein